jgi:hypothetical protein
MRNVWGYFGVSFIFLNLKLPTAEKEPWKNFQMGSIHLIKLGKHCSLIRKKDSTIRARVK